MVLVWFEGHPDVDLECLASLGSEERRQLEDLLVVIDDGCQSQCGCVFLEGSEVLSE